MALIVEYHQVRAFYADAVRLFPGPVPEELTKDRDIDKDKVIERLRSRNEVLAVHNPFSDVFVHQVCWPTECVAGRP